MRSIVNNFPITEDEYIELDSQFGQLCHYAAWQLLKKNTKNNHTDEIEDIAQELRLSLITAGSYYKRQLFIEASLKIAEDFITDQFSLCVLQELNRLWSNRTRHGANKQKFGLLQESLLESLINKFVPEDKRPNKHKILKIDSKFATYCKAIAWNAQKSMGKRITKEKSWRSGLVSLSEFDFLGGTRDVAPLVY
jgi:hypothetical protein